MTDREERGGKRDLTSRFGSSVRLNTFGPLAEPLHDSNEQSERSRQGDHGPEPLPKWNVIQHGSARSPWGALHERCVEGGPGVDVPAASSNCQN